MGRGNKSRITIPLFDNSLSYLNGGWENVVYSCHRIFQNALFEINITPVLEEALNKGLALHFEFEFGLTHPRWYTLYLWNDKLNYPQLEFHLNFLQYLFRLN